MNEMQTRGSDKSKGSQSACPESGRRGKAGKSVTVEKWLLDLLKSRDPEAPKVLMRKYRDKLLSVANRICNDPADAEEVLQDVYMTVFEKIDRFEERSTLGTWLYRITVNTALMKVRSQRFVQKNTVSMGDGTATHLANKDGLFPREFLRSPEDTLMSIELCEQILVAVENLPNVYRSVLLLRGIQGLSIKETSKLLNVSPAAIKSRLHRSRSLIEK